MRIVFFSFVILFFSPSIFAQDYKSRADLKVSEGDYTGAAAMYELCMRQDDECAFHLFMLIYEKKIEPEYSEQLVQIILPLAQKGSAEAQYYLASMYNQGYGVEKDDEKAIEWFRKAAQQSHQEAIAHLNTLQNSNVTPETTPVLLADSLSTITARIIPQTHTPTHASTKGRLKASPGFIAGLNFSGISGADFSPKMRNGFHIGALTNLRFGYQNQSSPGIFALLPQVRYSRLGFKIDDTACNLDYLSATIFLKLYVVSGLHIQAGPYLGYLLGVSPDIIAINGPKLMFSDLKGGLDAGVSLGIGFDTKVGFTMGAGYLLGLSELANNFAWKNRVPSVSIGWIF
ncbi:MAG: outer membrane beta-barrel protein [Prevotellaceae bacterium]|jgi:TPR repeat protein|nr:outer membrane beta-barrel protein [Prevotellaceae bacterium]